ncbi:MAG: hypothetical protein F4205_01935 [Gemmatimonadetes bacterium]|nr:hypothetical protein [Gemmatimonadota bacterium]MXX70959.1 hypothetical protein [Gemmatimonadota bacterium]MYC92654.1 hypothetical protein [Gemmatimonadota bacterium]MYG34229.1 hypothetical protein [Gemmatimonadota bacterium]
MAVHDAYARLTPYELLLPEPDFADRRFPAIGDEAVQQGVDTGNPAAFVMLGAVQGALAELREEDAPPESVHDHGSVLYFVYHLWRTAGAVVVAQQKTLRALLSGDAGQQGPGPKSLWANELAGGAGYIQLPQHLVWIEEARNGPPESVDGFFWFGDAHRACHLALVAGMRGDRPGFAVVPVPPQPLDALPGWAAGPAREGGGDFETSLPGAELDGLIGIRTPAEVFKLATLLLRRLVMERSGDYASPARAPDPARPHDDSPVSAGPTPSALPYVTL